jgi:hypothetical protein
MANNFKNAAVADVSTGSYDTLYTAPGSSGGTQQVVVLGLAIANKTSAAVTVQVQLSDASAGTTFQLLENVSIPAHTTLETLAGQKYILEAADALLVQAGTATALDCVLAVMEKT